MNEFTIDEIIKRTGLSRVTVNKKIKILGINGRKSGRYLYIHEKDVEKIEASSTSKSFINQSEKIIVGNQIDLYKQLIEQQKTELEYLKKSLDESKNREEELFALFLAEKESVSKLTDDLRKLKEIPFISTFLNRLLNR
jgi:hypothetical protein